MAVPIPHHNLEPKFGDQTMLEEFLVTLLKLWLASLKRRFMDQI